MHLLRIGIGTPVRRDDPRREIAVRTPRAPSSSRRGSRRSSPPAQRASPRSVPGEVASAGEDQVPIPASPAGVCRCAPKVDAQPGISASPREMSAPARCGRTPARQPSPRRSPSRFQRRRSRSRHVVVGVEAEAGTGRRVLQPPRDRSRAATVAPVGFATATSRAKSGRKGPRHGGVLRGHLSEHLRHPLACRSPPPWPGDEARVGGTGAPPPRPLSPSG